MMIRHTLNHYQIFCKNIVVFDNNSTDDTCEIIKKEYPNVQIKKYDSGNQIRDDLYLKIKNTCWKNSDADFVILCDADELLYSDSDVSVKEILKDRWARGMYIPKIEGYNMATDKFPLDYEVPLHKQIKEGIRATNFDKSIVFSPKHVAEINYAPGCHTCMPHFKKGVINNRDPLVGLKLLHYKYMGVDYVTKRHEMYAPRLSTFNKKNGYGGEYDKGHEHVVECFKLLDKHKVQVIK